MKLFELVNIYLKSINFVVKQKTLLYYKNVNEIYISKFENELNNENLNLFVLSLKQRYTFSTVNSVKQLINRSLRYAFENGYAKENLKVNVRLNQDKINKVEALAKVEQEKIACYVLNSKNNYYYGFLIALYTGVRLGELLALKWNNVDFENKVIVVEKCASTITKNHKTITIVDLPKTQSSIREIPISKSLCTILKSLKQNSKCDYVIASKKNSMVMPRAYQRAFADMLKRLKIRHYGFHALRHTFATRLLENGIDIKTISELMGHASPTITLNRYVHTNLQNKRKALETLTKKSAKLTD